jgi:hypothetical protein
MDSQKYKHFLLTHLPVAKEASGGRWIMTRCVSCADSKDPNKGIFI